MLTMYKLLNQRLIFIVASAVFFTTTILGCENQEEANILETLTQCSNSLKDGDLKAAVAYTSKDFLALPGKINRTALFWNLKNIFKNIGGISVFYHAPYIGLDPNAKSATVETSFIATNQVFDTEKLNDLQDEPKAWISGAKEIAKVYRLEIEMIKQGDKWLIQTVRFFD